MLPPNLHLTAPARGEENPTVVQAHGRAQRRDSHHDPDRLTPSPAQIADAVRRVKAQTTLSDSRVREVFDHALRESLARRSVYIDPVERAVMLATQRLWREEDARDLAESA